MERNKYFFGVSLFQLTAFGRKSIVVVAYIQISTADQQKTVSFISMDLLNDKVDSSLLVINI